MDLIIYFGNKEASAHKKKEYFKQLIWNVIQMRPIYTITKAKNKEEKH